MKYVNYTIIPTYIFLILTENVNSYIKNQKREVDRKIISVNGSFLMVSISSSLRLYLLDGVFQKVKHGSFRVVKN